MKEFLGHSIDLVAATLSLPLKTIQRYVLKCLNTEEKTSQDQKNSFIIMHQHMEFVIMEVVCFSKEY